MEKISIIIPVYNVELYIDQCLQSVCEQTYQNLEIILVFDESEDRSYERCLSWKKEDKRIRLIYNRLRKGLGAARNQAIRQATGNYIAFLDSDDWMEKTYVQRMYEFLIKTEADFVASSDWNHVEKGEIYHKHIFPEMIIEKEEKNVALSLYPTAWGKLFKRNWMVQHDIFNPEIFHCEDWSTLPLMVLQADRIGVMQGAGIYYRVERPGALTDPTIQKNCLGLLRDVGFAFEYFLSYMKKNDLFEKNALFLEKYCEKIYQSLLSKSLTYANQEGFEVLKAVKQEVLERYFPDIGREKPTKYFLLGGFSLRWEFQRTFAKWRECMEHYCFSSIISVMSGGSKNVIVTHKNPFRQMQVNQDITGKILEDISNNEDHSFLLLDFMEECYDILQMPDDTYCTYSGAFEESDISVYNCGRLIRNNTVEFWDLWMEKCDEWISFIRKHFTADKVILIKNQFAESFGSQINMRYHEEKERIVQKNETIKRMENYFIEKYPEISIIEPNNKYLFTDVLFRHERRAEYVNEAYYEQVSILLYEKIIWNKRRQNR